MKRTIICGLMSAVCGLMPVCADEAVEAQVKEIRGWYSAIEGNEKLKKERFSEGDEASVFEITRFTDANGNLKKIFHKSGGDHGVSDETYYFHEGKLFFVYVSSQYWRFTGKQLEDGQSETMDVASQSRLYFKDGKCIKALEKKIEIVGADEIRDLLQKQPNKEVAVSDELQSYANSAKLLSAVKSNEDVAAYLNKR